MWIRSLMRRIPGLSRIITIIDTMERDHLELVEAHTFLERSYLDLVANYRSLEQAYGQLQYKHHELGVIFQRLTRPTLQSNGHSKSEGIVIPNAPPIPPPLLRYWVAGHDDLDWFLKSGQQAIIAMEAILSVRNSSLQSCTRILDFGCGCGRVLRHLQPSTGMSIFGSDSNAEAIDWCKQNIPYAQFEVNTLEPALTYAAHSFDLIYAFSVFTHLSAELQQGWFAELHRCLQPGGLLIVSTHGDYYLSHLTQEQHAAYSRGELVVQHQEHLGENICSAFHSEAALRNLVAPQFSVEAFIAEGAKGNPCQDLYLLRAL